MTIIIKANSNKPLKKIREQVINVCIFIEKRYNAKIKSITIGYDCNYLEKYRLGIIFIFELK